MRHTVSDGSGRYDPLDIASLQLWQQGQQEDNRQQIRRLLVNLPLAVEEELTPRQRQIMRMRYSRNMSVTRIAQELGIPVKYVGVGEGIDDLRPFDARAYVPQPAVQSVKKLTFSPEKP